MKKEKQLVDPYDNQNQWHEFLCEDEYLTYLKCTIWHTDGNIIEEISSYKETPRSYQLSSGNYSTHWMLSKTKPLFFPNQPKPNKQEDLHEERYKLYCGCTFIPGYEFKHNKTLCSEIPCQMLCSEHCKKENK